MNTTANLSDKQMYNALLNKNEAFDGVFWIGVKSTGIFCRPVCTARKPKFENVMFFDSCNDALKYGFRPCKICQPLESPGETPQWIKNILKKLNEDPYARFKDYDLRQCGIEPAKIRRWFLKNHGLTFHAYQRMLRINNAFKKIASGESVTGAAFDSGYESLSGFSERFKSLMGTSPSESKDKKIIYLTRFNTPIGPMFAGVIEYNEKSGLCLLEFTDRRMLETEIKTLSKHFNAKFIEEEHKLHKVVKQQLDEYFEGKRKTFDIPMITPGTDFQNKVWKALIEIPYGETVSYKGQSINIKMTKAVRAVANANGMNRIAIIVPCHRVIGENGTLTGYGGGLWRKKWLLDFEKKNDPKLF
jgi:AraC family transcriptional regulator of adaptative response/methylated-DNA-[protein]-cysteine methyltransferase